MENVSEIYFDKLKNSDKPGTVLAQLYCTLYGIDYSRREVILCNQLVKFFGRFYVFSSIIDLVGSYPEPPEDPRPLLHTICRRRFEYDHSDSTIQARQSLEPYAKTIQEDIARIKKQKVKAPSAEGLKKDG